MRSTTRDARIPITPRCQSFPSTTTRRASRKLASASNWCSISSSAASSVCLRSVFSRSSFSANSFARTRSRVVKSSTTSDATSMRPAALMRGASRKPMSTVLSARFAGSSLACSIKARRPAPTGRCSSVRPRLAITRFSPSSGTESATVASTSIFRNDGSIFVRVRSRSSASSSACASLNATPAPHRCLHS